MSIVIRELSVEHPDTLSVVLPLRAESWNSWQFDL